MCYQPIFVIFNTSRMKPNVVTATNSAISSPLTVLPTAKIVRHPRAKKEMDESDFSDVAIPSEETLQRLNVLAKQHPFCIRHKGTNSPLL
jgi:hypothetical protein